MASISGNLSDSAHIIIVDESTWTVESGTNKSAGNFSISDLSSGNKTIIARTSIGECLGYGNVMAVEPSFGASGGNITFNGGYKIHTFLTSGTFTVSGTGVVDALVVAGGGAGNVGGGGAGGVIYTTSLNISAGEYAITVGNGGQDFGASGQNSVFGELVAIGGGGGGGWAENGKNGGSGGGGGHNDLTYQYGGTGTLNQGYAGGSNYYSNGTYTSGGGGGAGSVGQDAPSHIQSGNGGDGRSINITGTAVYYGGGGGGGKAIGPGFAGAGGLGGGGAGEVGGSGTNGTANTGGGGGGRGNYGAQGNGGSGIVIIRYLI